MLSDTMSSPITNIHLPPCRIEQNDKGQTVVSYDILESVSSQVRLIANKSAFEFSFRFWLILSSTIFTLFISLKYRTAITPVFSLSSAILRSFDWIHCNWSPSPVDLIQQNDGEVIKGRITLSIFVLKQMCLYPIAIHCFKCRIMKQHMKRPALQNWRFRVLHMAFRLRKVFGTFEKQATGFDSDRKSVV